jgi:DNA-binding response OmpR family regulator
VLGVIRSTEHVKTSPVAMLTSSGMESDLPRAYELGGNSYITKPVAFKEFVAAVSTLGTFGHE